MYIRRLNDLGALVRDRRRAQSWTQAQLAERLGVPRKTIVRLENAEHASRMDLILRALDALGVSLWADIGSGATPSKSERPEVDLASVIDDMLDEL